MIERSIRLRSRASVNLDARGQALTMPDPLSFFPYRTDYHYNAAGYALVTDVVLKSIGTEHLHRSQEGR